MWGGRLARPVTKGGRDAHPTSSSNLFLGSPLEHIVAGMIAATYRYQFWWKLQSKIINSSPHNGKQQSVPRKW
ncbi:MAG: hypothetical protein ACYT04_13665 [Nostoc sp.]